MNTRSDGWQPVKKRKISTSPENTPKFGESAKSPITIRNRFTPLGLQNFYADIHSISTPTLAPAAINDSTALKHD